MAVGGIILASGFSSRMGKPKLLLKINGKPILQWVMEAAIDAKVNPVVVVAGELYEQYCELGKDLFEIRFIRNTKYAEGMSSSIRLGVSSLYSETEALLVFLGDQPLVPSLVVEELISFYYSNRSSDMYQNPLIVRPQYGDRVGHPVLFDRSLYDELIQVNGDKGAREIIKKYSHRLKVVSFPNEIWGLDIDTPSDFKNIIKFGKKDLNDITNMK